MNFVKFEVNGKEYKLVLTTRTLCELEKKLGSNPIDMLIASANGHLPKVGEMVLVLWASCQKYNHSIKLEDCYDIFDDFIAEGNSFTDFINVMVEIYKVSGLITETEDESTDEERPN